MPNVTRLRLGFDVVVVVVCAVAAYVSLGFTELARAFPLAISVAGVGLGVANLGADVLRVRRTGSAVGDDVQETAIISDDRAESAHLAKGALRYLLWFVGCILLIFLFGLLVGSAAFVAAFLFVESRAGRVLLVAGPLFTFAGLAVLTEAMNLELPEHFIYFW